MSAIDMNVLALAQIENIPGKKDKKLDKLLTCEMHHAIGKCDKGLFYLNLFSKKNNRKVKEICAKKANEEFRYVKIFLESALSN